jgi:hypothetical protein
MIALTVSSVSRRELPRDCLPQEADMCVTTSDVR